MKGTAQWSTVNNNSHKSYLQYSLLTKQFQPAHEIMALIVLRKPILQTRMRSHPVGLYIWFLVGPFVYFHAS